MEHLTDTLKRYHVVWFFLWRVCQSFDTEGVNDNIQIVHTEALTQAQSRRRPCFGPHFFIGSLTEKVQCVCGKESKAAL